MKVTSVAVVLISLLVLCDIAFSAPNCGSTGVQDSYATQYCSCFSGYAPSDSTQSDCNAQAGCPAHEPVDTRTSVGGFPPFLYNASFMADRYNAVVRIPLVSGRRNATVRFKSGSNTCGYPGNLWQKKVNTLDCFDELWGSLPWTSNGLCGFTKSSNGVKTTYSANIMVTYDDFIQDSQGSFIRTLGVGLNVNVTFVTQTSVIYSLINLSPGLTLVTVTVIGNVIYDANTGLASVTLRTSATWPYEVASVPTVFSTPAPNTAVINVDALYDVTAGCTNSTGSACQQQYIMRINPQTGCNLGGQYVFNITLSCRSDACGSTYKAGAYSVLIYDTDVCGVGGVDVSLADGSLLPFSDASGATPASSFVPNQDVYFAFTLSSDAVTIDSITVQKITAATGSTTDVLYDLNSVGTPVGIQAKGNAAGLAITPAVTPASPGVDATLWFHVQLVDSIPSFRVLPSAAATVTISIIVDLTYHGNSKRSVEYILDTRSTRTTTRSESSTSSQGQSDIYISDDSGESGESLLAAASSVSPISSLFIAFALMLMLFINY